MNATVAHYHLLDRIGEGGLGEVYRARDTKVGRTVALKILPRGLLDKPTRRERFLADAAAASKLSHPNIATLFDVGQHDGRWFLAYEFVSGESLRQQMAGRAMHPRHALEIAIQLADGLAEAHAHGVLHGDLRPENIVVTGKGSSKLLDTGMAGWTRGGAARAQIATSSIAGVSAAATAAYMSPEQLAGAEVDPRTDIFSLGVIVYEMLTGRTPFGAATAADTVVNVTARVPPAATGVTVELPKELDATLARALARDLVSRQQSAVSLAAELRTAAAIFDVRAGDSVPSSLLPLDDDGAGAGKWWALAGVVGGAAIVAWLWFR
jgi:eukaryotic-like serine/threonine-protein kinase